MSAPVRIQRRRTKGFRLPHGTVYVGRPTMWGNPWVIGNPGSLWIRHTDERGLQSTITASWRQGELPPCGPITPKLAREAFEWWLAGVDPADELPNLGELSAVAVQVLGERREHTLKHIHELRGKNLACWCPLEDKHGNRVPCHADVLLEMANR